MTKMTRRNFLQGAGLGAAALVGGRLDLFQPGPAGSWTAAPGAQGEPFVPDAEISITATESGCRSCPARRPACGAMRASC